MMCRWVALGLTVALSAVSLSVPGRVGASSAAGPAEFGQEATERFWIAARYDATQLVTYFEAVKFGTLPTRDNQFIQPLTPDFLGPRPIAAADLERVRPAAGEPFKIGDRYDVLIPDGGTVPMTLTSPVKFHSDEDVGNDSYIGAFGQVMAADIPKLRGNYFVVRRRNGPVMLRGNRAGLSEVPRPQAAVTTRLLERVGGTRLITVQPFTTAAGDGRQLIVTTVGSGRDCRTRIAWLTGQSESRVVGTEDLAFCASAVYPGLRLRAAIDMGNGRTGLVMVWSNKSGRAVKLVEYLDGAKLADMRVWQSVRVGD